MKLSLLHMLVITGIIFGAVPVPFSAYATAEASCAGLPSHVSFSTNPVPAGSGSFVSAVAACVSTSQRISYRDGATWVSVPTNAYGAFVNPEAIVAIVGDQDIVWHGVACDDTGCTASSTAIMSVDPGGPPEGSVVTRNGWHLGSCDPDGRDDQYGIPVTCRAYRAEGGAEVWLNVQAGLNVRDQVDAIVDALEARYFDFGLNRSIGGHYGEGQRYVISVSVPDEFLPDHVGARIDVSTGNIWFNAYRIREDTHSLAEERQLASHLASHEIGHYLDAHVALRGGCWEGETSHTPGGYYTAYPMSNCLVPMPGQ